MVIEIITIDMVDKEPERKRGMHLGSFHKLVLDFWHFLTMCLHSFTDNTQNSENIFQYFNFFYIFRLSPLMNEEKGKKSWETKLGLQFLL